MKYLVTGAAGFIGYHLCAALLLRGDTVVGIDSLNDYYDPELKYDRLKLLGVPKEAAKSGKLAASGKYTGFAFNKVSLEDAAGIEALLSGTAFDRVVHLAAQAGVRYSIENPRAYVDANLVGFFNVLDACRKASTPHLVFASSSSVYGLKSDFILCS